MEHEVTSIQVLHHKEQVGLAEIGNRNAECESNILRLHLYVLRITACNLLYCTVLHTLYPGSINQSLPPSLLSTPHLRLEGTVQLCDERALCPKSQDPSLHQSCLHIVILNHNILLQHFHGKELLRVLQLSQQDLEGAEQRSPHLGRVANYVSEIRRRGEWRKVYEEKNHALKSSSSILHVPKTYCGSQCTLAVATIQPYILHCILTFPKLPLPSTFTKEKSFSEKLKALSDMRGSVLSLFPVAPLALRSASDSYSSSPGGGGRGRPEATATPGVSGRGPRLGLAIAPN